MLDPFHATIKMITGEEVLAEVYSTEENGTDFYVLSNPITINENTTIDTEKGVVISGLIPKRWMLFSNDDLTIVNRTHVVTMSELDKFGIEFYEKALIAAKVTSPIKRKVETKKNPGFVDKIDSFRKKLEGIFDGSPDLSTDS
jgi:hypothetical protein